MNLTNSENLNNINKLLIDKNYSLDYKNFYLLKTIKFILNFFLLYIFLIFLIDYKDNITKNQFVLIICIYSSLLLYVIDTNIPICSVNF